jgi:hypothetical protein
MRRPSRIASKARALGVRAVGRRCPHGREQRGKLGGFVVDHVVDAMRRRTRIEQASHGLRDVGVVGDRHALGLWEAPQKRDRLLDVRIAVAIDKGQPKHARVQTFDPEEEALRGELGHRVCRGRRAGVVLAGEAATIRTVDQAGAGKNEAPHGGGERSAGEVLCAEIVDRMRLLGSGAAKERGAVDHGVDASHGGDERVRVEQVAHGQLDAGFEKAFRALWIAHEGAHLIAALRESFGESASDLSGRSGEEDLHGQRA